MIFCARDGFLPVIPNWASYSVRYTPGFTDMECSTASKEFVMLWIC